MKNLTFCFFTIFIFSIGFVFNACSNAEKTNKAGLEYTSAYICPMHCKGSGSSSVGKCPVCKMDYVANKKASQTEKVNHGHDHSHGHDQNHEHNHDHGHNHDHNH